MKILSRLRRSALPLLLCTGALVAVTGCIGWGVDRGALARTAAFDHQCTPDRVQVLSQEDETLSGTGRYVLDVCGTRRQYKRAGTLYYDAARGLVVDGRRIGN